MASTRNHPSLITYGDPRTINLHSYVATQTPDFVFPPSTAYATSPIILLATPNPLATCLHIKAWLLKQYAQGEYAAPGILRMEHLQLEKIPPGKEGWLVVAPDAATPDVGVWKAQAAGSSEGDGSDGDELRVSIIALVLSHEAEIRWFYTLRPLTALLSNLNDRDLLGPSTTYLQPSTPFSPSSKRARLTTWLREAFLAAINPPQAPDFVNALQIPDCCPSILDPDNAVSRLEQERWLYYNTPKPEEFLSPATKAAVKGAATTAAAEANKAVAAMKPAEFRVGDDRYAWYLHPAERELAGMARLKCAEYLFVKRNFFRVFWEEVYRSEEAKKVMGGEGEGGGRTAAIGGTGTAAAGGGRGTASGADAASPATTSSMPGREDTPFSATTSLDTPGPSAVSTPAPPTPSLAAGPSTAPTRRKPGPTPGAPPRVRTETAHQKWLQREYWFSTTQARTLVVGWRMLGFLEEGRYVRWVKKGWVGDDDEDEDAGDERGGEV